MLTDIIGSASEKTTHQQHVIDHFGDESRDTTKPNNQRTERDDNKIMNAILVVGSENTQREREREREKHPQKTRITRLVQSPCTTFGYRKRIRRIPSTAEVSFGTAQRRRGLWKHTSGLLTPLQTNSAFHSRYLSSSSWKCITKKEHRC